MTHQTFTMQIDVKFANRNRIFRCASLVVTRLKRGGRIRAIREGSLSIVQSLSQGTLVGGPQRARGCIDRRMGRGGRNARRR